MLQMFVNAYLEFHICSTFQTGQPLEEKSLLVPGDSVEIRRRAS